MVKEPRAGQVKTRLARRIGTVPALAAYRTMSRTVIARLTGDPRWLSALAVTPAAAVNSPFWPEGIDSFDQGGGDLGARMGRIFRRFSPLPVVIVGSDVPAIRAGDIAAAFAALRSKDLVVGPAADGGYWLIGARRAPASLFDEVRWSGPHALADTLANAKGKNIARLRLLEDVDHAAAWRRWRPHAARRVLPVADPQMG